MFFVHLLFALFVALILSAVFAIGFRKTGPWENIFILFMLIFLISWAGGVWLTPMGPPLWGAYWLPFLLVGVIVALLLAAVPLGRKRESTVELVDVKKEEKEEKAALMIMGTFFWILVLALITVLFFRYI
jgi:hypothetical protein